jgi:hypothetical protein
VVDEGDDPRRSIQTSRRWGIAGDSPRALLLDTGCVVCRRREQQGRFNSQVDKRGRRGRSGPLVPELGVLAARSPTDGGISCEPWRGRGIQVVGVGDRCRRATGTGDSTRCHDTGVYGFEGDQFLSIRLGAWGFGGQSMGHFVLSFVRFLVAMGTSDTVVRAR